MGIRREFQQLGRCGVLCWRSSSTEQISDARRRVIVSTFSAESPPFRLPSHSLKPLQGCSAKLEGTRLPLREGLPKRKR